MAKAPEFRGGPDALRELYVPSSTGMQVPLGSMENFGGAHGVIPPGAVSLGGPIVTAGGLIFIAGSVDSYLRAFDIDTGKELWATRLEAVGNANPISYQARNGKQYVATIAGMNLVTFALRDDAPRTRTQ